MRGNWIIVVAGAFFALGAAYYLASGFAEPNGANVLVGSVLLPGAVFYFLQARTLRVEASPEGLVHHNMSLYTVRARWEDVEGVGRVRFRMVGEVECVLLRRSEARGSWLGWAVPKERRGLVIPLGNAWSTWEDVDGLRREVLRHAPHALS